ncbi:DUF323-domain-containing protein [Thozetella sp. PMI_491]|nr:DUF323-domain-containing protein [Thozetella sp. PMI_491]
MERKKIFSGFNAAAAAFGRQPLLVSPDGSVVDLVRGYIPLLVKFTFEDKDAKGLRKYKATGTPEPPVYFSALEVVRDHKILFLSGPSGSGKTSFAKYLSSRLIASDTIESRPLLRNEAGEVHNEEWDSASLTPCYFAIDGARSLEVLVDETIPRIVGAAPSASGTQPGEGGLLIILDAIEKAGETGSSLLIKLLAIVDKSETVKLLILGETSSVRSWVLPSHVVRHDLLPLLELQRRQAVSRLTGTGPEQVTTGTGAAAALPALFALALESKHVGGQAEDLVDAWLATVQPRQETREQLVRQAFDGISTRVQCLSRDNVLIPTEGEGPLLFLLNTVQQSLAARHLAGQPPDIATAFFQSSPTQAEPILRSLLVRLEAAGKSYDLLEGLIRGSGPSAQRGALLASDFVNESCGLQERILQHILSIVEEGILSPMDREKAGRVLSRLGDPRDLAALASVPAGTFIMGSDSHPNSQPPAEIWVDSFRIGLYPVVNRDYSKFIEESSRVWRSPDGRDSEKQNVPATDLTWHDAMAYCAWLTTRWRKNGRIGPDEQRAARGDRGADPNGGPVYPWGMEWVDDAANCEETGFNTTCAVGLFPKGRSKRAAHTEAV